MCGRLSTHHIQQIYVWMEVAKGPDGKPIQNNCEALHSRYNLTPTHLVPSLTSGPHQYSLLPMIWGILPAWAANRGSTHRHINARSETVFELKTFKESAFKRRCVVFANGFYEWKRNAVDKPTAAYYIHPKAGEVIAIAGIYLPTESGAIECCVLTTEANSVMHPIHDRMPCLLSDDEVFSWLDAETREDAECLLRPSPPEWITAHRVSNRVNSARNEGPDLILPYTEEHQQGSLF